MLGALVGLAQHPDEHRLERPVLIAVDQEFREDPPTEHDEPRMAILAIVYRREGWAWRGSLLLNRPMRTCPAEKRLRGLR